MGNKATATARLFAVGYKPPGQQVACRKCRHITVKPKSPHSSGVSIHCEKHKAYVAAGGWCPDFEKDYK